MKETNVDKCTKRTVVINNENYYLVVGDKFVHVTVPRENDPFMSETRQIAETLSRRDYRCHGNKSGGLVCH